MVFFYGFPAGDSLVLQIFAGNDLVYETKVDLREGANRTEIRL